jgi:hypothetical protein
MDAAAPIAKTRAVFGLLLLAGWLWLGRVVGAVLAIVVFVESTGAPASFVVPSSLAALVLWIAWIAAVRPRAGARALLETEGVDLSAGDAGKFVEATGLTGIERVSVEMSAAVWRAGGTFTIGYALLRVLRENELRIAAAFAEAKASRGITFASWARRLGAAWEERAVLLTRTRMRAPLHRRFMPWYAARLAAAASELESNSWTRLDRRIAAASGVDPCKRVFAQGAAVDARLMNVHWPTLWSRTDLDPEPPTDAIESLALSLEGMENDVVEDSPTFGRLPAPRAPEPTSAADLLPPDTTQRLSDWWQTAVADSWTEEYRRGPGDLAELEACDEAGHLTLGDLTRYAYLVEQFRTAADALPIYVRAAAANPDDAIAAFRLGALLLGAGDVEGVQHIEHAMELDFEAVDPGCTLLAEYSRHHDDIAGALEYEGRLDAHRWALEAAELERRTVGRDERLLPHGLDEDALATLRGVFDARRDVHDAYLARKEVHEFVDAAPVFVVGVVRKAPALRFEARGANDRFRNDLLPQLQLPGLVWMVVSREEKSVARWFQGAPDAKIYSSRRFSTRTVRRFLPAIFIAAWWAVHSAAR